MVRPYRNISFATAESFQAVLEEGKIVTVRGGQETREIRNRVTTLSKPRERCVFLPGRRHDIFAQIAETMWVLAGRDDIAWLTRYLPRAPDFSDDGKKWRGAYGPRLRQWPGGIDQLAEWRRLLLADRSTRRAVGVIFDPARDFVESHDIPCNNWLSWVVREGQLHMNVGVRSNDAMWGFSGVNAFEWSVLQEMMALWVDAEVGEATFFATSFHIYERHYERASEISRRFYGVSPYDFGVSPPPFQVSWHEFPAALADWFEQESRLTQHPDEPLRDGPALRDPFLGSTLRLLRLKWGAERWDAARLKQELALLPEDDFAAAAYEFFSRGRSALLTDIEQSSIAKFFDACRSANEFDHAGLKSAIKLLHARKNASYGASWKRRGERVSVLPNIARKIDRLETFVQQGMVLQGETVLDTALDFFVYAAKYQLFLAELPGADVSFLPESAPTPLSDLDENFDTLVDAMSLEPDDEKSLADEVTDVVGLFAELWPKVESGAPLSERERLAAQLTRAAERLVGHLARNDPRLANEFIRQELSA